MTFETIHKLVEINVKEIVKLVFFNIKRTMLFILLLKKKNLEINLKNLFANFDFHSKLSFFDRICNFAKSRLQF